MDRKYTIYAVDFDGTLCELCYPEIGAPNMNLITMLINQRNAGDKIILWTCREEGLLLLFPGCFHSLHPCK